MKPGVTTVHLTLGAVLCFAAFAASGLITVALANQTPNAVAGLALISALFASLLIFPGRAWGRRSVLTSPLPLAITVTAVTVLPAVVLGVTSYYEEVLAGAAVWIPGLTILLYVVARLARAGRGIAAWVAGIIGWLTVLDVAVVAQYLPHSLNSPDSLLWFPAALTGQGFGVLSDEVVFKITDEVFPELALIIGMFATSYVIGASSRSQASS